MSEYWQISTSAGSEAEARRIAGALVERRLAACVQVSGPITSTYWWEGKIETAQEWLCLIKSRRACYPAIEAAIKTLHSYTTPEIVAVPIVEGSGEYLGWIDEETRGEDPGARV